MTYVSRDTTGLRQMIYVNWAGELVDPEFEERQGSRERCSIMG